MSLTFKIKIVFICLVGMLVWSACQTSATPTPQVVVSTSSVEKAVTQQATATKEIPNKPTSTSEIITTPEPSKEIVLVGEEFYLLEDAKLIDDFKKEYPNINLKIINKQYSEVPDSSKPCVVEIDRWHLAELFESGKLADITNKVTPYLNKLDRNMLKYSEKDGKYYSMPWIYSPAVFHYRRDFMKEAGLSDKPEDVDAAVATWDDFLELCKTIKAKTGRYCFEDDPRNGGTQKYMFALEQQGLGYFDEDGKVTVDSPQNIATLEELGKFWEAGLTDYPCDWESKNNTCVIFFGGSWASGYIRHYSRPETYGLWGVARMPAMAEGQARAAIDNAYSLAIPETCQDKESAWAFIEYMLGREDTALRYALYIDNIPALKIDAENPLISEPNAGYAGQVVRPIYWELARNMPQDYIAGPDDVLMDMYVAAALRKYDLGQMSAAEALKEAADKIRQETGMP